MWPISKDVPLVAYLGSMGINWLFSPGHQDANLYWRSNYVNCVVLTSSYWWPSLVHVYSREHLPLSQSLALGSTELVRSLHENNLVRFNPLPNKRTSDWRAQCLFKGTQSRSLWEVRVSFVLIEPLVLTGQPQSPLNHDCK